jgi:hypothetical protein
MTYLYQPTAHADGAYLRSASVMPLRQNAAIQPLLTSTDERLAGRDGILGDEVKGIGLEKGKGGAGGAGAGAGDAGMGDF